MNASRRPASPSTVLAAVVLLAVATYVVWSGRDAPVAGPAGAPVAESPAAPSPAPDTRPSAASPPAEVAPAGVPSARPAAGRTAAAPASSLVMRGQRIHDEQGRLVYEGDVDLAPVFARIDAGERDPHRNDGTTFANREGTAAAAAARLLHRVGGAHRGSAAWDRSVSSRAAAARRSTRPITTTRSSW
ncbi:MAG: hypothetical protein R2708_10660 [Vicinamibacterales bacterium]